MNAGEYEGTYFHLIMHVHIDSLQSLEKSTEWSLTSVYTPMGMAAALCPHAQWEGQ